MEPPEPDLPPRETGPQLTRWWARPPVRLGLGSGAALVALTSGGDATVLFLALAGCAGEVAAVAVGVLLLATLMVGLGTTNLAAVAGWQAVFGPAGWIGPPAGAASAWCGSAALVVAAPAGWAAVPFGLAAALLVAGPAPRTLPDLAVRAAGTAVAVGLAWSRGRWIGRGAAWLGVGLGIAALGLAWWR